MSELSRYLMVTGGNVTGLTDELEQEGLVVRAGGARRPPRLPASSSRRKAASAFETWPPSTRAGSSSCSRTLRLATARSSSSCSACCARTSSRCSRVPTRSTTRRNTIMRWPAGGEHDTHRVDPGLVAGNRKTAADYRAEALRLVSVDAGRRHHHAEPPRAQEPADLRLLRRAARPVPAAEVRRRREGGGDHRRRRQLLLRRRRARDHRPAGAARHARAAGVHPHDRRPGEGDARLPAADRRRHRRRVRRRRRDRRDGVRPAPRHRAQQDRVPVHPRRPGRLRHGRLRDAAAHHRPGPRRRTAVHRPGAWAARKAERWGFFNRLCAPEAVLAEAQALAARSLAAARPSPTA